MRIGRIAESTIFGFSHILLLPNMAVNSKNYDVRFSALPMDK